VVALYYAYIYGSAAFITGQQNKLYTGVVEWQMRVHVLDSGC
jgi:hypothetical protein